jgi:hypothetical protein
MQTGTHCVNGHEFTPQNTRVYRGQRLCKRCIADARYRWRHRDQFPLPTPEERFWSKVDFHGPVPPHRPELGPCWLWTKKLDRYGYGRFFPEHRKNVVVHRYAYELVKGSIPEGKTLDHLCHDPSTCTGGVTCPHRPCLNPAHLDPISSALNRKRGVAKRPGNGENMRSRTHCPQGHPYDDANTHIKPNGSRSCRACARDYASRKRRA